MPAVDDGAANIDECRTGLTTLSEQGVRTIVTTPHFRASQTVRPAELESSLIAHDVAFATLLELAASEFPQLRIERGIELMLDVPAPVLSDERLRLAGTSCVLIEFPHMNIPPHSTLALREMRAGGVIPIIAHPERYSNMAESFHLIESWRDVGAGIQINSGSVVGQYGDRARKLAWAILYRGWADYLSSDYHSRGRCSISQCAAVLSERGAGGQLQMLTLTNPERMLSSEPPLPVEPVEEVQESFWRRLLKNTIAQG